VRGPRLAAPRFRLIVPFVDAIKPVIAIENVRAAIGQVGPSKRATSSASTEGHDSAWPN
jgi:hypothetical protein